MLGGLVFGVVGAITWRLLGEAWGTAVIVGAVGAATYVIVGLVFGGLRPHRWEDEP